MGSVGKTVDIATAFNNFISSMGSRALTSIDITEFASRVLDNAPNNTTISTRESNRWHGITQTYVKTGNTWSYTRRDDDTGDIYEQSTESSRQVSSNILSTARSRTTPYTWEFNERR